MSDDLFGNSSDDSGIGKYLEKIGGLDIITAAVLLVGAFTIYSGFEFGQSLTTVSLDPAVIAVQLSGFMGIVYLLEFKADEEGGDGYNHSLGQRLEKMASMDALTLGALGLNAYVLYTKLDFFSIDQLLQPGGGMTVIALQASVVLGAVYLLELKDDSE